MTSEIKVSLHLCCNDERGQFDGLLRGVEIYDDNDALIGLVGPVMGDSTAIAMNDFSTGLLAIGRLKIRTFGYREWVGNWCWDAATVRLKDAVRVVNYLRKFRYWHCEHAESRLFDKWKSGELFTEADFLAAMAEVF